MHMSSTNAAQTLACNTPLAACMPSVVTWAIPHVDAKAFFERNMSACTVPGMCYGHELNIFLLAEPQRNLPTNCRLCNKYWQTVIQARAGKIN